MNTGNKNLRSTEVGHDGVDQIAQLLGRVDPRPPLPDERKQRVRDAVHSLWERSLRARRHRHVYLLSGSLAAILALAIFLTPAIRERISIYLEPPYQGPVAEVAVVRGLVWHAPRDTPEQYPGNRLTAEVVVEAGTRIETTSDSRVALRLLGGHSVRLDHGTRVHILTPATLELQWGALYVDAGPGLQPEEPVEIQTALGSIYDVGTQFEVRFADETLRVRVREGLIGFDRPGESVEAVAGIELSVDAGGQVSRRPVQIHGPIWDWILEIAPAFRLEGSSLPSFLEWVGRETGRDIRFSDASTAGSASSTIVHGSIEGMRPDAALEAVLATCGLAPRMDGEAWILDPRHQ